MAFNGLSYSIDFLVLEYLVSQFLFICPYVCFPFSFSSFYLRSLLVYLSSFVVPLFFTIRPSFVIIFQNSWFIHRAETLAGIQAHKQSLVAQTSNPSSWWLPLNTTGCARTGLRLEELTSDHLHVPLGPVATNLRLKGCRMPRRSNWCLREVSGSNPEVLGISYEVAVECNVFQ